MTRRVVYLMSGAAHLPYLATSIYSLRKHWSGAVVIYAWPESIEIARQIANDPLIHAMAIEILPAYRGKNDQFLNKILLMQSLGDGQNLYLDADTLVLGSLDEMFTAAASYGFASTQFNNWMTGGPLIRNRLARLREFPAIIQSVVEHVLISTYPSVNGGVFASEPDSPVLPLWYRWSWEARSIFIADECVLHLMTPLFQPEGKLIVAPGYFNSSPKYTNLENVRICHGHGDCFTRPDKCARGHDIWWAALEKVRHLNLGGINQWINSVGNKYLDILLSREQKHETAVIQ